MTCWWQLGLLLAGLAVASFVASVAIGRAIRRGNQADEKRTP